MSSIITRAGVVLAAALILLSIGCSKERTPGTLINPNTGRHAAQWETPAVHGAAAKGTASSTTGLAACQECHNADFSGGISKSTCLNTAGCHGVGLKAPHSPAPWRGGTWTHVNTDRSNAPVCAQCHTNGANSSVQPAPFNPGAAPGCFNNTLCHAAVGHPPLWENPFYHGAAAKKAPGATSGFRYCQLCHGNDFTGDISLQTCLNTAGCHGANVNAPHSPKPWRGVTRTHTDTDPGNAPVCAQCHTNGANSPVQPSPFDPGAFPGCFNNTLCHAAVTTAACGSCHAIPPNGTSAPNQAGRHAVHDALINVTGVCNTCHNGAGNGTSNHINGTVDVAVLSTYNAMSSPATYDPAGVSCSNVSCHGGQTTPGWLSGTVIDVNTQCASCHVSGTTQYNSYYSGEHAAHISQATCYYCHDINLLAANHFTSLNTTAMEGPASATISSALTYTPGGTPGTGSCTPACHDTRSW